MINFNIDNCTLEGINLIESSAGTGKTHNISRLFIRILIEKKYTIDKILVVTFTEAATEELRKRIREELKETIKNFNPDNKETINTLEYALNHFDEVSIFTIHGFCRKILQENAFESSNLFDTELISDQNILLKEIIYDFWRIFTSQESPMFLEYIYKSGIKSENFYNLIKNYISRTYLKIIPSVQYVSMEEQETNYRNIYQEVKKIWENSEKEIINLLWQEGLNKRKYSDKVRNELHKNINIFFNPKSNIHTKLFKNFEKLTIEYIMGSINKGCTSPEHIFFDKCMELYTANNELVKFYFNNFLYLKTEVFKYVKVKLNLFKKKQSIQYFDDLLYNVYKALKANSGKYLINSIKNIYKAALIDEFQDTDPIQYFIFNKIFQDSILFFIGDPKQAIYSFRGADIYAYLQALKASANTYTLEENWRSENNLVSAVNTIFANRPNPFLLESINFKKVKSATNSNVDKITYKGENISSLFITVLSNMEDKSITKETALDKSINTITEQIKYLLTDKDTKLGSRNIIPEDIAVLVRTNRHAVKVQKKLNEIGIPGVLYSTENLFKSDEAAEFERILIAIADPANEKKVIAALATDYYGYSGDDIFQIINDQKAMEQIFIEFHNLNQLWAKNSFIKMITFWENRNNVRTKLLSFKGGERKLTNLLHLIEVLHNVLIKNQLSMDGLIQWLSNLIIEPIMEHQIRLETDERAVKLVTIHKAKGLQYPIVFCPFLWYARSNTDKEFIFHNESGELFLDIGSEQIQENKKLFKEEELAESLRLVYVSLTRAINRCYIITGKINGSENSGLSYLLFPNDSCKSSANRSDINILKYPDIIKRIKNLENESDKNIKYLEHENHPYKEYRPESLHEQKLKLRTADITRTHDWKITSFSSISHSLKNKYVLDPNFGLDYDNNIDNNIAKFDPEENTLDYKSIHTFPKGAKTGRLIHSLFEDIDFNENTKEQIDVLIKDRLISYDYDEAWAATIFSMINNVLNKSLGKEQIQLSNIKKQNIIKEMEFLFPLNPIIRKDIENYFKEIIKTNDIYENKTSNKASGNILSKNADLILSRISELSFNPLKGYVKGFIDLIFKYDDKYYIVDWKTNYLGSSIEEYNNENISKVIVEEYYFLQYYFYTLALHKYLSINLKDYSYSSHFGGIFYIFTRGINSTNNNGIYFDSPDTEIIMKLNNLLIGP